MVLKTIYRIFSLFVICFLSAFLIRSDALSPGEETQRIHSVTRKIEFSYEHWMVNAIINKSIQSSVNIPHYMNEETSLDTVRRCFELTGEINQLNAEIQWIYSNPEIENPAKTSLSRREELSDHQSDRNQIAPYCESIVQDQISNLLNENDLTLFGQAIPPVLYEITPLPVALIVSPRDVISQEKNISLIADLSIDQIIEIENQVESLGDYSALIVPVGGVGVYPTMVMSSTNIPWTLDTVSHEWTHNFLTLHPLGILYDKSSEIRTINETTANIVGKEIGSAVIASFFPEFAIPDPEPNGNQEKETKQDEDEDLTSVESMDQEPPQFDFRVEMRETRINVDAMLEDGLIEKAEEYMERRRQFFWENGFQIRKINQAYFAFYGAYADAPGGAAGDDPIGSAVVSLREKSESLSDFLRTIAWVTSYEGLLEKIQETEIKAIE